MPTLNIIRDLDDNEYHSYVGHNASDNWNLIDNAKQNDIWFHIKDRPSAHVILVNENNLKINKIPKTVVKHCAMICKQNSKFDLIKNIKIIYTEIKNVKKADIVGSVHIENAKYIVI